MGRGFVGIDSGSIPDWLIVIAKDTTMLIEEDTSEEIKILSFKSLGILSPTKRDAAIFDFQTSLSFDSTDSSVIGLPSENEENWCNLVSPTQLGS
jgi:hypothetical protein